MASSLHSLIRGPVSCALWKEERGERGEGTGKEREETAEIERREVGGEEIGEGRGDRRE